MFTDPFIDQNNEITKTGEIKLPDLYSNLRNQLMTIFNYEVMNRLLDHEQWALESAENQIYTIAAAAATIFLHISQNL